MVHNEHPVSCEVSLFQASQLVPTGCSFLEDPMVESILLRPDLDDRDARMLLLILSWQKEGRSVTQSDLAAALHVGTATVTRRLHSLKERRLISINRLGRTSWEYDLSKLRPALTLVAPVSIQDTPGVNETPTSPDSPCLATQMTNQDSDYSSLYINTHRDDLEEKEEIEPLLSEGAQPMRVIGQESPLKTAIQSVDPDYPSCKQRFSVPQKKKTKPQTMGSINCVDMESAFRRLWREKWKGSPIRWTLREKGHLKELIRDHGPADVLTYICYVFDNWEKLSKRFGWKGFPSVVLLYGFRRTLLPESLNPPKAVTVEFRGDDTDAANAF